MSIGLKVLFPEIHLMDSMSITQTRTKVADIHIQTKNSICTALIEHYTQVLQTEKQMHHVEKAISSHMHKDPRGTSSEYRRFLNKLERNELRQHEAHLAEEKRVETLSTQSSHKKHESSTSIHMHHSDLCEADDGIASHSPLMNASVSTTL